jgi:hypothetical protein
MISKENIETKSEVLESVPIPESLQSLFIYGGAYFESGIRNFADWSTIVLNNIGQEFKPYLRGVYESLRHYPGLDTAGMNSPEFVEEYLWSEEQEQCMTYANIKVFTERKRTTGQC